MMKDEELTEYMDELTRAEVVVTVRRKVVVRVVFNDCESLGSFRHRLVGKEILFIPVACRLLTTGDRYEEGKLLCSAMQQVESLFVPNEQATSPAHQKLTVSCKGRVVKFCDLSPDVQELVLLFVAEQRESFGRVRKVIGEALRLSEK